MPTFNIWNTNQDRLKLIEEGRKHPDFEELHIQRNHPNNLPDPHGILLLRDSGGGFMSRVSSGVKTIDYVEKPKTEEELKMMFTETIQEKYIKWRAYIRQQVVEVNNKILLINTQEREQSKRDSQRYLAMERLNKILRIRERRLAKEKIDGERKQIEAKKVLRHANEFQN